MSAESPRRTPRKGSAGHVVLPQAVSDPSIIDSVAGFIHDVVPQVRSQLLYMILYSTVSLFRYYFYSD